MKIRKQRHEALTDFYSNWSVWRKWENYEKQKFSFLISGDFYWRETHLWFTLAYHVLSLKVHTCFLVSIWIQNWEYSCVYRRAETFQDIIQKLTGCKSYRHLQNWNFKVNRFNEISRYLNLSTCLHTRYVDLRCFGHGVSWLFWFF